MNINWRGITMYRKHLIMSYGSCASGWTWVLSTNFPYIHFVKFDFGIAQMRVIETPFKIDWYKWLSKIERWS